MEISRCEERKKFKVLLVSMFVLLTLHLMLCLTAAAQDKSAVIATAAADYSSGAHDVITVDPIGGPRDVWQNLAATGSDISVFSYGSNFYRLERSNAHSVTKFNISSPATPIWQFSTEGNDSDSNPYDMIFLTSETAYLLRYGTDTAWIVDPSTTTEAGFKKGELDLSSYSASDGDGYPEMCSGVIVNGKLFITLQRIDSSGGWGNYIYDTSYVAVFDTSTNQEIDTGKGSGGLYGIPLPYNNSFSIQYFEDNDTIYVQSVGQWDTTNPGGITAIDPDTYDATSVLSGNTTYGAISGLAVASSTRGYFIGYAGWGNNTLYSFDPSGVSPTGTAITGFENLSLGGMENALSVDENGMLWICNQTDGQIDILDTTTDTIDESVETGLNPLKVVFVNGIPEDEDVGANDDGDSGCFISSTIGEFKDWSK